MIQTDNLETDKPNKRIRLRLLLTGVVISILPGCSVFRSRPSPPYVRYDGSRGSQVLKTAMSQYGVDYEYGAVDPGDGFDCSGLIWWSYRQHGITVPRRTVDQRRAGWAVSRKNICQGDIVVFRIGRNQLHTGLVVDKNRFLHAPSSGGYIRIDKFNDAYWKNRIVGFRRIVS